jgi:hypothetical protein
MFTKVYRSIAILLVIAHVMSSIFPLAARATNTVVATKPELAIQYGRDTQEAVKIKLTNQVVNGDGSITANLSLEAPAALTYGLNLVVTNGEVSGPAIDKLLKFTDGQVSIPFVGRRTLDVGPVTFSPGSTLQILTGKWGNFDDETAYIFTFDAATAITLFTGLGYLPTKPAELLEGLYQATVGLVVELGNLGLDLFALSAQLLSGDIVGAFQTIGGIMELLPEVFADYLRSEYNLPITASQTAALGKVLHKSGPVIGIIPLIADLIKKPTTTEAHIRYLGTPTTTAGHTDIMLVLDRSGSMAGQPIVDARLAAKLFVDLTQVGDKIGVASFASSAQVDYTITAVSDASKQAAKSAIDGIVTYDTTSIGAGLAIAQAQLSAVSSPNGKQAIILLSDGDENEPPYVADILPDIVSANTIVHTIGLGYSINAALLQDIANQTGGLYRFAPNSADLAGIYNSLLGSLSGQQQAASGSSIVAANGIDEKEVFIGSQQATFTINWTDIAVDLDLSLVMPDGTIVQPDSGDPTVEYVESLGYEFYRVTPPQSGKWKLNVVNPTSSQEDYSFLVTLVSQLEMDAYLSDDVVRPDEIVIVTAALYDSNGPVTGALVTAKFAPDDAPFKLFDDGAHQDGEADDGIYRGQISTPADEGTHTLYIDATGSNFTRQDALTILVDNGAVPESDLWLTGSCPETVEVDSVVNCELIYGNRGPNEINAVVSYTLPPDTTFLSSTLGEPTLIDGDLLYWSLDNVTLFSEILFTVSVLPASTGSIDHHFTLEASNDPVTANNVIILKTSVEEPAVNIAFIPMVLGD